MNESVSLVNEWPKEAKMVAYSLVEQVAKLQATNLALQETIKALTKRLLEK
jgi:hypothetical protein